MASAIPDLWRAGEDAERLYQLYLIRLSMHGRHDRVIAACRAIRRYASRGPGAQEGLFTLFLELDPLCALRRYETAWRCLRQRERIIFGEHLNLDHRQWTAAEERVLRSDYAPILYFRQRYRRGCSLLETSLDFWFCAERVPSFEILFNIYNDVAEPESRLQVTLQHFYRHLGRDLHQWRHWESFINGFHPRLFRLAGVPREALRDKPAQFPTFFNRLMEIRAERTTSGATYGERDLIESPARVRKRQEAVQDRFDEFTERIQPRKETFDAKLRRLFPELSELPERGSD